MAYLDPDEAFQHFRDRVLDGIKNQFPIEGRNKVLELEDIEVRDNLSPDDIRSQHEAKVSGQTWGVPVVGTLVLKDKSTGQVSRSKVRLAELPKVTKRYSQIVEGQEYQVDSQWQLKPGAYVRRRQSGELETRFQTSGKPSFDITFDSDSKVFRMEYNKAKLPLYPIMKAMGVGDEELKKAWGEAIFSANAGARKVDAAVTQFYRSSTRKPAAVSVDEATEYLKKTLESSVMRPDATELTLGKPIDHVNGEALRLATEKMLKVQHGAPEDDRDSLAFKDLRSLGDYAYDKIRAASPTIRQRAQRKINTASTPAEVIKFDIINKPIRETFTKNSAAQRAKQVNPVEMVSSAQQTTVMGPGGIQSERSIVDETKFINPSHMAFLDPIHTPEGSKTGITLRLPIGVKKEGNEPKVPLFNVKTGRMEYVNPKQFLQSNVVLPDQVEWKDGKPVPVAKSVKVSVPGNKIEEKDFKDVDYVMRHHSQFFNATSNLIPFLSNTSGGRASMASRHIEQAISLVGREAPLVQVGTPSQKKGTRTFEELMGQQAAHTAPVSGTVKEVKKDAIVIRGEDGKEREVQLYNNYPLNDSKSVLDSTPLEWVKPGAQVKAGDVLADTNFSKDGQLALGANLRVAYIPYKGYNFEDGVVISERAAQHLASQHLYKPSVLVDPGTTVNKRTFGVQHHGVYTKDQLGKIGDDGVVSIGQKVNPGDPLVLATKKVQVRDRQGLAAIRPSFAKQYQDQSLTWEGETAGEVVGVYKKGNEVHVHIKTIEPMQVGDKIAGRYGNKGIVTRIIPDDQMPKTPDGAPIDVALNPSGVPGRMNVGQVLETAASKIAKKTGQTYVVNNFDRDDVLEKVKKDLQKHGIKDTEPLFDPITKQPLGEALVGYQHMLKLHHQVDKKVSVRSGMDLPGAKEREKYDINLQPTGGGHAGGQSIDPLGLYSMLAHGAKANIREMMTYKAEGPDSRKRWPSQHHDVWDAIQHGDPIPTPKPTFAFKKFTDFLKGAGINIEKKGHEFILSPLTDQQIKELAGDRVLTKPSEQVYHKVDPKTGDPKPKPGGLFDDRLTGGHGGHKWSRIELPEPVPNPVFELPIRALTGLTEKDYNSIVFGEKAVNKDGKLVELGKGTTGGAGIELLLSKIDVTKELERTKQALSQAKKTEVDKVLKKAKYLSALEQLNMKPSEAYVLHNIPVLPPVMRPVTVMPDGNFNVSDINQLYSQFAQTSEQLKDPVLRKNLTEEDLKESRKAMYDGVKAIVGIGIPYKDAEHKGLIHQIHGSQPKQGFFQSTLISRKQDLSMRSTIVPEPALGLDEVGLPKEHAMKLLAPFIVQQLRTSGVSANVVDAQKEVAAGSKVAERALQKAIEDRPVLLKRDPALHKYSVQAFKPRIVSGNAIQIHPLVTGGYNADFDGDTMSVFVPVSEDARLEAFKMMPSNNLFSEATGKVMYQPTLESALGLYKLSRVNEDKQPKKVASYAEAILKAKEGKLNVNDPVIVGGVKTTPGRVLLATALPESMQDKLLKDLSFRMDKGGLDKVLTEVARTKDADFGQVANKLKDIGNNASFGVVPVEHSQYKGPARLDPNQAVFVPMGTHSLGLDDFKADKRTREQVLKAAQLEVQKIKSNPKVVGQEEENKILSVWEKADQQMKDKHLQQHEKNPSNLLTMQMAKVKPSWDQYKQMVLAPMIVLDASGKKISTPITHSYAEGLDTGEYWTQMSGARRGSVLKVQEVREPGALSKLLMATTMDLVVAGDDCSTSRGIALPVSDREVFDRYLVKDFKAKNLEVPAGTLLTPDLVSRMRAADKNAQILVRSPLKCEHDKGICKKCMGIAATGQQHDLGENVGISAAQTLGERAVQLTLKEFHTGGAAKTGGEDTLVGGFKRFNQLTKLPRKMPDSAMLAKQSGTIEKIEDDPTGVRIWIGGKSHHVPKDRYGNPLWKPLDPSAKHWTPPRVGMKVEAGQPLSDPKRTVINPHDLYKATGSIEKVQNYLSDEIYKLYKDQGIKRQSVEVLVKAMSNLTKVRDPGDYDGVLRGEFMPQSKISAVNRELVQKGKKPVQHEPVLKGVDMLPLSLQDDWMAKLQHQRLEQTILDAAATMGKSNIHSSHPIPGIAYGAEFGITSKDIRGKSGLKHLEDVPTFVY